MIKMCFAPVSALEEAFDPGLFLKRYFAGGLQVLLRKGKMFL
jgi:hypothetical protein